MISTIFEKWIAAIMSLTFYINSPSLIGNGVRKKIDRSLSPFDKIEVTGSSILIFEQGKDFVLTIEADENLLPYIRTEVRSQELILGFKPGNYSHKNPILYTLKAPTLKSVVLAGCTQMILKTPLTEKRLEIHLSGTSSVEMPKVDIKHLFLKGTGHSSLVITHATLKEFDIKLSGISNLSIDHGTCRNFRAHLSGHGTFEGKNFEISTADFILSGHSCVTTYVTTTLKIRPIGFTTFNLRGHPCLETSGPFNFSALKD